jgi:uncharacterized membrane protein YfbV (UPF0208 family)
LAVYPHRDGHQLAAVHAALAGATWTLATRDGDTIAASLGQGRVLLCRESIDAAGHDNPSVTRWQQRWLSELKAAAERPVPVRAPTLDLLAGWWTGRQAITAEPRVVTWFGDNRRQVELSLDPSQPLGAVFTLTVPPTGAVQDVQFTLSSSAASEIALDFGGEGSHETVLRTSEATLESPVDSWFQEVARRLEAASHRDDNGWRVLPVRVTATTAVKVVLSGLEIVVQGGSPPAN